MIDLERLKIEATESFEDVNDLLYRVRLTDGLPVVPPTPGRVAAMLGGREAEQVLTTLAPLRGRATMRQLAMCAVMAGCRPAYFPIVLAATAAVAQPEFNLFGIQTTTGTATPLIIVNGPVVQQRGLNAAANALAPLPSDLRGKRIGILDNTKSNADVLMLRLAELLCHQHGAVEIVHRRKAHAAIGATDELCADLVRCCDAVLSGSGD